MVDLYAKFIAFGVRAAELFKSPTLIRQENLAAFDLAVIRRSLLTHIDPLIKAADDRVSKLIEMEYMSFAFEVQNGARVLFLDVLCHFNIHHNR